MNRLLLLLPLLCFLTSCNDSDVGPAIPHVVVSEQLNVNSPQYPLLRQDGGYAYIRGGYRGLLIVRQNAGLYLAFERACPYDPTAACAMVEADPSNLFLVDRCCGSQFNLQGQVMDGPAVYGLKQYYTSLAGTVLYISN